MFIILLIMWLTFSLGNTSDSETFVQKTKRDDINFEEIEIKLTKEAFNSHDPVCNLSKKLKINLCERIFNLNYYKQTLKIYINKTAFYLSNPICEEKQIMLVTKTDYQNGYIVRRMYPCYGRHQPIETSLIEDNYYMKFYLSFGLIDNSVMVYEYDFDDHSEYYTVFQYLQNIEFFNLSETSIIVKEIIMELNQNKIRIENIDSEQVEYIFIREEGYYNERPICDIEQSKKLALCRLIYEQDLYKTKDQLVRLHEAAFRVFDIQCLPKLVEAQFALKRTEIKKYMYPCFSRVPTDNVLESNVVDEAFAPFYVSDGPRRNSVLVYGHIKIAENEDKYMILEMYENIRVCDLKPESIELKSRDEIRYKDAIQLLVDVITETDTIKMEQLRSTMNDNIAKEMQKFDKIYKPSRRLYQQKLNELNTQANLNAFELSLLRTSKFAERYEKLKSGDEIFTFEQIKQQINEQLKVIKKMMQLTLWSFERQYSVAILEGRIESFFNDVFVDPTTSSNTNNNT